MSEQKSPEEIRQENIRQFGQNLGLLYTILLNEVSWLKVRWKQYQELFGTNPERIDILNEVAGLFFRIIQDGLLEDTLLHICRITDPPESAGAENLTIRRLPDLIEDEDFNEEIAGLVDNLVQETQFARDWRNRRLAHSDLALAMEEGARPLEGVSRERINKTIGSLHQLLHRLSVQYSRQELSMEVITPADDALSLLYVLRDGLAFHRMRMDLLRGGEVSLEEMRNQEPV